MRLLLASASPRRAELLRAAGFDFDTVAVDIGEAIRPGELPEDYVQRMASEKSARAMEITGPANRLRQGYGGPPKLYAKAGARGHPHQRPQ